jgi:hypothetical protein
MEVYRWVMLHREPVITARLPDMVSERNKHRATGETTN